MEAEAFISHTEMSGTYAAELIQDHLSRTDLEMKSFLSKNTIKYGDDISEEILNFLVKTDVLFVIFESGVTTSDWVKWEYEFCKERGILTIPIVVEAFQRKLKVKCPWVKSNEKFISYKNDGQLADKIYNSVDDRKEDLERRALERNKIQLKANSDKSSYTEEETVKISGKIKNAIIGTAYLHIPIEQGEYKPLKTQEINKSITPDGEDFEIKFKLPKSPSPIISSQKWFIELKFATKSKIIPINIRSLDEDVTAPNKGKLSESKPSQRSGKKSMSTIIKEKVSLISRGTFQSIPQTINDQTITRSNYIDEITGLLKNSDRIVVTGEKGSGKSVLMCQLYKKLAEQYSVLLLRCDDYLGISSLDELNEKIIPGFNFIDSIQRTSTKSNKLIIILDSLDAISRNEKSMNIFKQFLKSIWGTSKVQTITSVRSYDYEYSPSINTTDWGKQHKLELLKTEELDAVLTELGSPKISDKLKSILYNPLHLQLLSLILKKSPDADFTNIKNEIELYDEHWNTYVDRLERSFEVQNSLYEIVQSMSSLQKISIPYGSFGSEQIMQEILSRNIISRSSSSDSISFFHHAYLDYVTSRFILSQHSEFVDYLQEDEYNVFLRPTIVFALSILNKRDPKQAIRIILKILHSELKYFWKISTITALAKINENDNHDLSDLGNFLTNNGVLQRHFLMEIKKQENVLWFNLWKDSFFVKWSSVNNTNSWFIVDYLKSIVTFVYNHAHIFKLLQLLVSHSEHDWTKRETMQLSSEIDAEGKAKWLLRLSSSDDTSIRSGIAESLPKLIETDPEIIPDVFCNLFTYVETSTEQTQLGTYGTMALTSTKTQDNSIIIWKIGELFPELLKKDPAQMLISVIRVFETLRSEELKIQGDVVEDHGYIWFKRSSSYLRDENKILHHVINYLKNCSDQKIIEFIPTLKSTRLATIHSILLECLINKKKSFKDEIFQFILNPRVYKILTLGKSVRTAIKEICPLLEQDQIKKMLAVVMNIKFTSKKLDEESKRGLIKIKAGFLSEFPEGVLQPQHKEILNIFSRTDLKYEHPYQSSDKIVEASENADTKLDPEDIIARYMGKELESGQKIELLEAIAEYLGKKTKESRCEPSSVPRKSTKRHFPRTELGSHELSKSKFQPIREFLIQNKDDPDPQSNSEDDESFMIYHATIRGLTAKCLILLLFHSNDKTLVPIVKELANDPINKVRGEVCDYLGHLFYYDYDLTYSITLQYSVDPDIRIQFFLRSVLNFIVHKNPAHATLIVSNMLNTLSTNNKKMKGIESFLIYLALHKKEKSAIDLLNKVVDCQLFSPEVRSSIPFRLKEEYLFKNEFQNQSLDILYRLLDDPDPSVRHKAALFTLNSFEKNDSAENEKFVKKIGNHLDRISAEVYKRPLEPRLLENLVGFLEEFWHLLPEKTIDYLEEIIDKEIEGYSTHQPVLAKKSVKILTGLFQHRFLSLDNRERCLNILDKYAMAGWHEALKLLSAMERPD